MEFWKNVLASLVAALIVAGVPSLVAWLAGWSLVTVFTLALLSTSLGITYLFVRYALLRRMGLAWFLPRGELERFNFTGRLLRRCKPNDEILFVGRTLSKVVNRYRVELAAALQSGAKLRMVVADPRAFSHRVTASGPFRTDSGTLAADLTECFELVTSLCDQARANGYPGSLSLRVSSDVVLHSLVAWRRERHNRRQMQVHFDFSFGTKTSDKYAQVFSSRYPFFRGPFAERLFGQYHDLFDEAGEDWISFSPAKTADVSTTATGSIRLHREYVRHRFEAWLNSARRHDGGEPIRDNGLEQVLPYIPGAFGALHPDARRIPAPVSVQVELTNVCTTECVHCERYKWPSGGALRYMDSGTCMGLLRELREIGTKTITLSGGEPTTHPDFGTILHHADSLKLKVGVLTNGVGSMTHFDTLIKHAAWVRVSLDAARSGTFEKIRGSVKAFDEVKYFIRRLAESKPNGVGVCFTIQRENIGEVEHMLNLADELKLPPGALVFKFVHGPANKRCLPDENQLKVLRTTVLRRSEFRTQANLDYVGRMVDTLTPSAIAGGLPTRELYLNAKPRCWTPFLFSLVDAEGGIYVCCHLYEDNDSLARHQMAQHTQRLAIFRQQGDFIAAWEGRVFRDERDQLEKIDPRPAKYAACGQCTRHFQYNLALSDFHGLYTKLAKADPDSVNAGLEQFVGPPADEAPWF